jgi:hypothetical protein
MKSPDSIGEFEKQILNAIYALLSKLQHSRNISSNKAIKFVETKGYGNISNR